MEEWNIGIMEYWWDADVPHLPAFHYSIIPVFQ
jgi:hypothetical protein